MESPDENQKECGVLTGQPAICKIPEPQFDKVSDCKKSFQFRRIVMKRLDLFVVGLVLTVICGTLYSLEVQRSVTPNTSSLMIDVGACTTGQPGINNSTAACYMLGTEFYQNTGTIYAGGQMHTQNQGCASRQVVYCSSQTAVWPAGATESGSYISAKSPCGGTYLPTSSPTTSSAGVYNDEGVLLYTNLNCNWLTPLLPWSCGQKNVISSC
jgi:hypothetical protein